MLIPYIECGQIVSTHGVKGEVRVNPWCDSPSFLTKFKKFYLDEKGEKEIKVISSRPANNVVLMKLEGINDINEAQKMRNTIIYISREDADIGDRYFIKELIGCKIYDAETKSLLGEVEDVTNAPANDVWHIKNEKGTYLVPAIDDVIVSVDVKECIGYIKPLKGIFEDED